MYRDPAADSRPQSPAEVFENALALALRPSLRDRPGALFLAALSGGADSTAMTAALAALREKFSFRVHCIHVNHGIRSAEACAADEESARALCRSLDIPLTVKTLAPGTVKARAPKQGIEGAARHFRHAFFREERRRLGADRILIAHTRDDLLETILMAFLRGAGSAGLGGMRPHAGVIRRPLLSLGRRDVLLYLEKRGLSFVTDESNADSRYLRNRVRHTLIPVLNSSFPHWQEPLIRFWETQGLTADFLAREAAARVPWDGRPPARPPGGTALSAPGAAFFGEDEIIREEALFLGLDKLGAGLELKIRRAALRPFVRGAVSTVDLGRFRVENSGDRIGILVCEEQRHEESFSVLIKRPGVYKLNLTNGGAFCRQLTVSVTDHRTENSFFAGFPLALNPEKVKYLAAWDRNGKAAVLGNDGSILWKRTAETDITGAYFAVK